MFYVEPVLELECRLGEGCVWDEENKCLYFVDIESFKVYCYYLENQQLIEYLVEDYVGCIVMKENNSFVAAVKNKLVQIDKTTARQMVLHENDIPDFIRYNDGKCDVFGNIWIGTMAIDQTRQDAKEAGSLFCIKDNKVVAKYDKFTIPNGLAWSEDGSIFYHIDTATHKVDAYDVEEEYYLKNKRTVIAIDESEGSPDGMCMDAEGNLWIALWGGSKVVCYDPSTGKKLHEILVPDKNVSCCTFGGEDLKTLYITTAKDEDGNGGKLYQLIMDSKGSNIKGLEDSISKYSRKSTNLQLKGINPYRYKC